MNQLLVISSSVVSSGQAGFDGPLQKKGVVPGTTSAQDAGMQILQVALLM
jgi:hypothetical protein